MRTSQFLQAVSLSLAALLVPVLASAQQTPSDISSDKQAKPAKPAGKADDKRAKPAEEHETADGRKLEKLEDPEPPAVKIGKPPAEHKVTETRDDSGAKEVKVETGVSTYYVRPNQQVGTALPGDTQSTTNRGAEWKVMEFNLGGKKKKPEEAQTEDSGDKK
ncbi:MAG: hypothetical protein JO002_13105 [Burkholderiaceae bacterium]|nr:hypothetical protein [Burkholderiaceae bacterium]